MTETGKAGIDSLVGLNELAQRIRKANAEKGFDLPKSCQGINNAFVARALLLIHTEISEATEELRGMPSYYGKRKEYERILLKFTEELADVIIRTLDLAGGLNLDIQGAILKKLAVNKQRPRKHGKRF